MTLIASAITFIAIVAVLSVLLQHWATRGE
jgi:hypothetical protein